MSDEHRQWLAELYQSDFPVVFRACYRFLGNRDDATDAAHHVFLKAIESLQPGSQPARPWLLVVARNHCLDVLRRRNGLGRVLLSLGRSVNDGANPETAVIDRQFLRSILQQLGLRERQALWQSDVEQRPLAAIARDLQLSYMAAAQLVHRARRHALLVAARVAAILGLAQLGRGVRRAILAGSRLLASVRQSGPLGSRLAGYNLVAVAVVPLLLASLQSASSTHESQLAPPVQSAPSARVAGALTLPAAKGGAEVSGFIRENQPPAGGDPTAGLLGTTAGTALDTARRALERSLVGILGTKTIPGPAGVTGIVPSLPNSPLPTPAASLPPLLH